MKYPRRLDRRRPRHALLGRGEYLPRHSGRHAHRGNRLDVADVPRIFLLHHTNLTYFIAIGGFAHVVVGSGEAAYAVLTGASTVSDYFFRFLIPTGLGNIIGGTGIFTLLVSAQVKFGHE